MCVECCKSMEATTRALAISHVFWFESALEADVIAAPSTASVWLLWVGCPSMVEEPDGELEGELPHRRFRTRCSFSLIQYSAPL